MYFVPPFEWYNADHVEWAKELGCRIISFTSGSGFAGARASQRMKPAYIASTAREMGSAPMVSPPTELTVTLRSFAAAEINPCRTRPIRQAPRAS